MAEIKKTAQKVRQKLKGKLKRILSYFFPTLFFSPRMLELKQM